MIELKKQSLPVHYWRLSGIEESRTSSMWQTRWCNRSPPFPTPLPIHPSVVLVWWAPKKEIPYPRRSSRTPSNFHSLYNLTRWWIVKNQKNLRPKTKNPMKSGRAHAMAGAGPGRAGGRGLQVTGGWLPGQVQEKTARDGVKVWGMVRGISSPQRKDCA